MKIDPKDIEYIKIKDSCVPPTKSYSKEDTQISDLRLFSFMIIFGLTALMFTREYPFNSFFLNFRNWTFFEFLVLKPEDTIAILSALGITVLIDQLFQKIDR